MVGAPSQKKPGPKKEQQIKDDGRYIIFYTFKDEGMREAEPSSKKEDAG